MKEETLQDISNYLQQFGFISNEARGGQGDCLIYTSTKHQVIITPNHIRIYQVRIGEERLVSDNLAIFSCTGINYFRDINDFIMIFHITGVVRLEDFMSAARQENARAITDAFTIKQNTNIYSRIKN